MRLEALHLTAWGPFTDQALDLSEGNHGLHLIMGENEAGKSSALRAISSALFGISTKCGDNFVHEYSALRVGAVLRNSKDEVLSIVRRKGTKNTLLDAEGHAIQDAALAPFLGGMEAGLFGSVFGIGHEALRQGGADLLAASGNLGQAIVAASAGYRDLKGVLEAIDAEAEGCFKPGRGGKPVVNKALAELKEARDAIARSAVKWSHYEEARKFIEKNDAELEGVVRDLAARRATTSRLERVSKALPLISQRRVVMQSLEAMGQVTDLPDSFSNERSLEQQKLQQARDDERKAAAELERLTGKLEKLTVPDGLLEQQKSIAELQKQLGSHEKAERDLPTLQGKLKAAESDILGILEELGRRASLEEVASVRLPATLAARIQELTSDNKALVERVSKARQDVEELKTYIDRTQALLDAMGTPRDASKLGEVIERAIADADPDKEKARLERWLQEQEAHASSDLRALGLWAGPLDQVGSLPVPGDETMERFALAFTELQSEERVVTEKLRSAEREGSELEAQLGTLRLSGAIPTEQDLIDSRARRDQSWEALRSTWQRGAAFDAGGCEGFARCVTDADEVSDRLRRESDRVAKQATLLASKLRSEEQVRSARESLNSIVSRRSAAQQEWERAWAAAGIVPRTPAEMRGWAQKHAKLSRLAQELASNQASLRVMQELIATRRCELGEALQALGEAELPSGTGLSAMLKRARAVFESAENERRTREQRAAALYDLRAKLATTEKNSDTADESLEEWKGNWEAAILQLGLAEGTTPAEAGAFLGRAQELLKKAADAAGFRQRMVDIERDAAEFERAVSALVARVAPDLATVPAVQVVAALDARWKQASADRAKRAELEESRDKSRTDVEHARGTIALCEKRLEELCTLAGCESVDAMPLAEQRSAEAIRLRRQLHTIELQLGQLAAGGDTARFIEEAEHEDVDSIPSQIETASASVRELEDTRKTMEQEIGAQKARLANMKGTAEAAEAADKAESIKAQIRDAAERYIRARMASAILHREIESYRNQHQGPMMRRASELFASLTAGSFGQLRLGYDQNDEPVIVGVRQDGEEVPIEGLSDGTKDQVHLSLRLASVESFVERNEPVPFIVDDVFVHFDDRRAAAALEVFGELSRKVQVIVFTHHEHLLGVARRSLPSGVLFEHKLQRART